MPRSQPKLYQLLIKTHKTTIFISAAPTLSIAELKSEILSALLSDVNQDGEIPKAASEDDFEISQAVKDRGAASIRHVAVDATGDKTIKGTFVNWEVVFLQFKDDTGTLLPVEYTPLEDDDAHIVDRLDKGKGRAEDDASPVVIGKRKAPPE